MDVEGREVALSRFAKALIHPVHEILQHEEYHLHSTVLLEYLERLYLLGEASVSYD